MLGAGPGEHHYLNVGVGELASLLSCPLNINNGRWRR